MSTPRAVARCSFLPMRRPLALALAPGPRIDALDVVEFVRRLNNNDTHVIDDHHTPRLRRTTTKPTAPVAPLTGLPYPKRLLKDRSALTIKIDNTPEAMPQYGVNEADVVYEEIVEGGITRLAAIFNSQVPKVVGPVRSVRRTDREIVFPIGGIFAFSGGAEYAVRSIETAPVKLYDESNAGAAMFRDPSREVPHNLFANAQLLMAKDGKPRPPPALFTYLSKGGRSFADRR